MQKPILILFLLFPSFLFSQDLPINYETKKVEYTKVIDIEGATSELFSRAKSWISSTFNSSQDLIQTKDDDYLAVKGLALIDYVQNTTTVIEIPMHFTLSLDFADNKYRYKITNIYFEYLSDLNPTSIPIEQTALSRKEQEEVVAKQLESSKAKLSENEFQETLSLAFNRYDQFKSKGHWTIMGILQLLTNGMENGVSNDNH